METKTLKKTKKSKNYFTQDTEDAIILYNKISDSSQRSKIYEDKIHYAFFKLTQNIIHTFKFYNTDVEDLTDLQHELIIFLLSKVHLYHHSKNIDDRLYKIIVKEFKESYKPNSFLDYTNNSDKITQKQINDFIEKLNVSKKCLEKLSKLTPPKAYSYFGTISKRWLILYNDKNYKKKIDKSPIEDIDQDEKYTNNEVINKDKLSNFIDIYVEYCTNNLEKLFPDEEDSRIADAILELFRRREHLLIFNKKALYIYIREIIDVKTPKITKIADKLSDIFKVSYVYYLDHDLIKF